MEKLTAGAVTFIAANQCDIVPCNVVMTICMFCLARICLSRIWLPPHVGWHNVRVIDRSQLLLTHQPWYWQPTPVWENQITDK